MKKILTTIAFLVAATVLLAQVPQQFSYQGVVRDAAGNLVRNAPVGVRVSLLKNSADGIAVYCETHRENTNTNGVITLIIGGGTVVGGDMASINWGDGPYFLKTETDITGGSNYTLNGCQQLLSVPYALYASNAADMTAQLTALQQQIDSLKEQIGEGGGGSGSGGTGNDGKPCKEMATITDADNNVYNTVQIGSQCWMKENLRTTKYADGTDIKQGSTVSYDVGYWYYPNNDAANKATYGLLYNWKAVMRNSSSSNANPSGVQGICPTGWHVPSDDEWTQLTEYLGNQLEYACHLNGDNIAKALASTTGWNKSTGSCHVGNGQESNNATGFTAVPAGYYNGSYSDFGDCADYWSATEYNSNDTYARYQYYNSANVTRNIGKNEGFSVRCVRD